MEERTDTQNRGGPHKAAAFVAVPWEESHQVRAAFDKQPIVLMWDAPAGRQLACITSRASRYLKFRQIPPRKHLPVLLVPAPIKKPIPIT